ncbi:MAG: glycosyltransferase [Cyclobacteriaceae bacterium]
MIKPTVTIWCITYNHEKFISEALESFLMQETSFDFDIVIGDDCSTDNTVSIIESYQTKYPDKIKLLKNEHNRGFMHNFIRTLKACKGKYIAMCEGDDYWTDKYKLQKQIDFLENNADFSACFHNVKWIDGNGCDIKLFHEFSMEDSYDFSTAIQGWLIHMNSICMSTQTGILNDLDHFKDLETISGDRLLVALLSTKGRIGYLNEIMSVYRRHDGSITGNSNPIRFLESNILVFKRLKDYLKHEYHIALNGQLFRYTGQKALKYQENGDYLKYSYYLLNTLAFISSINDFKAFIKLFVLRLK